jgi:hypothetical protein
MYPLIPAMIAVPINIASGVGGARSSAIVLKARTRWEAERCRRRGCVVLSVREAIIFFQGPQTSFGRRSGSKNVTTPQRFRGQNNFLALNK